jgi:hypothetical protein
MRINRAVELLKRLQSGQQTIECMRQEYGLSRPQAYRYVREAGRLSKTLPIPEKKEAMMVKLPIGLIKGVRRLSKKMKESISGIITEAIRAYLRRHGA